MISFLNVTLLLTDWSANVSVPKNLPLPTVCSSVSTLASTALIALSTVPAGIDVTGFPSPSSFVEPENPTRPEPFPASTEDKSSTRVPLLFAAASIFVKIVEIKFVNVPFGATTSSPFLIPAKPIRSVPLPTSCEANNAFKALIAATKSAADVNS